MPLLLIVPLIIQAATVGEALSVTSVKETLGKIDNAHTINFKLSSDETLTVKDGASANFLEFKVGEIYSLTTTGVAASATTFSSANAANFGTVHLLNKAAHAIAKLYEPAPSTSANAKTNVGSAIYYGVIPTTMQSIDAQVNTHTLLTNTGTHTSVGAFYKIKPEWCGEVLTIYGVNRKVAASITSGGWAGSSGVQTIKVSACPPSAKGDPHVTNVKGERFDLLKSGMRSLVQYPRDATSDPSLVVMARIVRADAKWCENTFIEQVQAHGSMLGANVRVTMGKLRSPGPFTVFVDEKAMTLDEVVEKGPLPLPRHGGYITALNGKARKILLTLAHGVTVRVAHVKHTHFQFLNVDVSGLMDLPGEVGGLLGLDDHSGEEQDNCKWKRSARKFQEASSEEISSVISVS